MLLTYGIYTAGPHSCTESRTLGSLGTQGVGAVPVGVSGGSIGGIGGGWRGGFVGITLVVVARGGVVDGCNTPAPVPLITLGPDLLPLLVG